MQLNALNFETRCNIFFVHKYNVTIEMFEVNMISYRCVQKLNVAIAVHSKGILLRSKTLHSTQNI
jgi:hypothetical protein